MYGKKAYFQSPSPVVAHTVRTKDLQNPPHLSHSAYVLCGWALIIYDSATLLNLHADILCIENKACLQSLRKSLFLQDAATPQNTDYALQHHADSWI